MSHAYATHDDGDCPLFDAALGPSEPFKPTLGANPVCHTNDPPTSREAAVSHASSGRRAKHAKLVLALVMAHPGRTAVELYHHATADVKAELKEMQEVRRRLTDLQAAGLVRQGGQRKCSVKKTTQVIWFPEQQTK